MEWLVLVKDEIEKRLRERVIPEAKFEAMLILHSDDLYRIKVCGKGKNEVDMDIDWHSEKSPSKIRIYAKAKRKGLYEKEWNLSIAENWIKFAVDYLVMIINGEGE